MILHMCFGVVDLDDPWANGDEVFDMSECPVVHHWAVSPLDYEGCRMRFGYYLPACVSRVIPDVSAACAGPGLDHSLEVCG